MVDDQDWKAAISSEVFRNYVAIQLNEEAIKEAKKETEEQTLERQVNDMDHVLTAMDDFENKIKSSPQLLAKFKAAKMALLTHPELIDKVDSNFVKGIMMLNLPEEE